VLNTISNVTAAADTRFGFGVGVFPLPGAGTAVSSSTGAVAARPCAYWATHVVGKRRFTAGLGAALGQQNPSKQNSIEQYDAQVTRIAAASGGGALGSHPAREPEPV
jgi:hypothetical protein